MKVVIIQGSDGGGMMGGQYPVWQAFLGEILTLERYSSLPGGGGVGKPGMSTVLLATSFKRCWLAHSFEFYFSFNKGAFPS